MLFNGIQPCTFASRESLKQKATSVSGSKMTFSVSDHYSGYYLILLQYLLN